MIRSLVDGMCLEAPVAVPGAEAPEGAATDWTITIERGPPAPPDASIQWTGDVRNEYGVWANFGRHGDERIVSLRGVAELRAHPGEWRATMRHAGLPSWDVPALRRVSPYLATLLGRTALHAASVVLPAGAVLFCADSGTGKSTLALALDRTGFAVLGDDHVVFHAFGDGTAYAHPSFPFVDVSRPASDGVGRGEGKASVEFSSPRPTKAMPIAGLAFLHRGSRVARAPMTRHDAFVRLLREFVFVADPMDDARQAKGLDATVALLKAVPAVQLEIPDDLGRIATTAAEVAALWSGDGR